MGTPDLKAQLDADAAAAAETAQLEAERQAVAKREAKATAVTTEAAVIDAAKLAVAADAARRKKVGVKRYKSKVGVMIDPDTQKVFNNEDSTKSELTSWLQFQIDNDKIELDTEG